MGRKFNIAGPCKADLHYMLPPIDRLPEALELVHDMSYFVVHAPRQTGKTTTISALARYLTESGEYAALTFSCESCRGLGDDVSAVQREMLAAIRSRARIALPDDLHPPAWSDGARLHDALMDWSLECPRPLVLFIDEIDVLTGLGMMSVLSQIRSGYPDRPDGFPWSVVLCGMRNVRDYKMASGSKQPDSLGTSSPFNITAGAYRLADFTVEEIADLYGQHMLETGQELTSDGIEYAYEVTQGQPWLVNALAREVIDRMKVPAEESIGPRRLETAKERLIRERATHLDSLVARLEEPRVQRIVQPLITGELRSDATYNDDVSFVRDLGLIAQDRPLRIANPIYREVIPRVLGADSEDAVKADPRSFVRSDGTLAFNDLLTGFTGFWIENGEILTLRDAYHEAAPQLVLMGYLHRLVNGGGYIDREYGVGRGRIDLLVRWPYEDDDGNRVWQREALELKVWRDNKPDPLDSGLEQLDAYLERLGLPTGTLVIFDRREDAEPIADRTRFETAESPTGRPITVLRA